MFWAVAIFLGVLGLAHLLGWVPFVLDWVGSLPTVGFRVFFLVWAQPISLNQFPSCDLEKRVLGVCTQASIISVLHDMS